MLAQEHRLRRERDIARVYRKGRFGAGPSLQIKALATGYSHSRAAIVVSRKISKKAVVRNRIKRRLSAQLRESWQTVRPGYDIVITVRADVSAAATNVLAKELTAALVRSGAMMETKG